MKINIMAAGGQLGRKVVDTFLECGIDPQDLIASVRTPAKVNDLARMGIDVRRTDYDDPPSLKYSFRNSDVVVLITSTAMVEERKAQFDNAFEAACSCRVERLIFTSIAATGADSLFSIAPFYTYAEKKLQASDLGWTILRDGMYLDPVAEWVPDLVRMGRLPYPVKKGKVAYISRDDIARAIVYASVSRRHAGQIYDLTGSEAISMPQLAETISRVTGKSVVFEFVSEKEFTEICRVDDIPESLVGVLISMYRAVDNGEFERVTDHVEVLTGKPPESVESYLRRMVGAG